MRLDAFDKGVFQRHTEQFNARGVAANIHDAMIALEEGNCDLMIVYRHPLAPILLDPERFGSLALGHDAFIPLCAPDKRGRPLYRLPGNTGKPFPHLACTATTFLGRVAKIVIKNAPAPAVLERCYEADMAMLLMRMAIEGYGVAWLRRARWWMNWSAACWCAPGGGMEYAVGDSLVLRD